MVGKTLLKRMAATVGADTYRRLLPYAILKTGFGEIASVPTFETREQLWDYGLDTVANRKVTFVEFGVHEGYSIGYFARRHPNPDSEFIGLDSFEGLPEDWGPAPKGTFSTNGAVPTIGDARVSFIKGWFQDTWEELAARLRDHDLGSLIVHYDADLYTSTLYTLSKIDSLGIGYLAIFDEFTGQELLALDDYCNSHCASVSFLGKTLLDGFPLQVLCRIEPRRRAVR